MGFKMIFIISILVFTIQCEDAVTTSRDEDYQKLTVLFKQLQELSESQTCTNPTEWKVIAYGSKACGGPQGFLAYSTKIDEINFLKLVEQYTLAEQNYNQKWSIISDCSLIVAPLSVDCEAGKPKFIYN